MADSIAEQYEKAMDRCRFFRGTETCPSCMINIAIIPVIDSELRKAGRQVPPVSYIGYFPCRKSSKHPKFPCQAASFLSKEEAMKSVNEFQEE
jgi:hypothetical protein